MTAELTENETSNELAATAACSRIPPLWPLQNFVAVNPFLGLADMSFIKAAHLMGKVAHSATLMDSAYYLRQLHTGAIQAADIRAALARHNSKANPIDPVFWLKAQLEKEGQQTRLLSVADWLDYTRGTNWGSFIVDEISKWCSSYYDRGQSAWAMPSQELPLYLAWKRVARFDRNPEVFGLSGFRRHLENLPDSAEDAIAEALAVLNVPPDQATDFLHRELMSVFGWSAHAAFRDWQNPDQPNLRQLLAVRLAYDTALFSLAPEWQCRDVGVSSPAAFTEAKYIAQYAAELAFRSKLAGSLMNQQKTPTRATRKALQAIFCIDVRSEVYRRALEAQSPDIQTIGFAGFFGMPVDFNGAAHCPVLLQPGYSVQKEQAASTGQRLTQRAGEVWKNLLNSPSASFSSIETAGISLGIRLLKQLFGVNAAVAAEKVHLKWSIPLEDRISLVAGAIKNMSLEPELLAPVVLICGHGSASANNPYASSLDCGACGGNKGDLNARLAAALMNDPAVRRGLRTRGINIPADTVFIAGLHNTTTDEVTLSGDETLADWQQKTISRWLDSASERARIERAGIEAGQTVPATKALHNEAVRRSTDWSEVRPEWGLAGNATFIAAPRSRTAGLNLHGRAFLHDYDPTLDPDASVLQLILTAPVVVASWINLQYYGSTVNNQLFGSGNKVLHNVVGGFGVWEGNGGDLRTGLPLQSLHDGTRWMHEPLRLQVFIEAPTAKIDGVLRANPSIRALVENGWIHLLAIEGDFVREWRGASNWHTEDRLTGTTI